ncbi:MAG: helix-turn-helix domain-containing protein [Saprospiraceae bacterium]|nr:helix-turn-helix domain-containing protein [Saprospiraceae bacterium]
MQAPFLQRFDAWMGRTVALPDDTEESFTQKKSYLTGIFPLFGIVAFMTLLTGQLELRILTNYGLALLVFFVVQFVVFIWLRRGLKWFVLISNSYNILLAFVTMLKLGGIPHSGGLIFVGLTCVVYSMIYPSARVLWWSFFLYLATLALTAALQPQLTPAPEMVQWKNLLLFVLNSFWLSANILILVFYVYRNQAEIAKLKAQRLQEMDELKTRMFANIAHEFRTPLTLIGGMADLIKEDPQHQLRERAEVIQRNANKVLRLVNQMLNLARLEAGAMPLNLVQSDVAAFLKYVFNSFTGLSEHKQVRMHYLPENLQLFMDFDPEKMEEMLGNLLSNAIKYTPSGGNVYLNFHVSPTHLILHVKDTGIGILPEKLAYIFDRFYRVGGEQQHYEEGSGIGLTLVREYVQLMGGEISVESKPNEGSEFTVMLPIANKAPLHLDLVLAHAPKTIEPLAIEPFSYEKGKEELPQLLVIEDNPELSQYLKTVLGPKFRLLTANDGEKGIQLAIEQVPDLILSDVMMPGKDGFEVCRTLKKDFRTCHIPIVLLTARADTASRIMGLEQGADAYLTKPFNKRELLVCLRNLFAQREKLRIKYSNHAEENGTPHTAGLDEVFLKNAQSLLEKNFADESFGIEELYHSLGISRVQLHRKLMALTGQSASHFIRNFRLEKAKELLLTTTKSVSEIAYETGFSDANYFSRVFAQEFGLPPSDVRKGGEKAVEKPV